MAKVNFKDKQDIAVPKNVNETNLITASNINELKNSINTNYDEFTNFKNTANNLSNSHDQKLRNLESSINQNKSDISQLKQKPANSGIKIMSNLKSTTCPEYNNWNNVWYLTPDANDILLSININIDFKNGTRRTFSFAPDASSSTIGFQVIANGDGGEPRVYYFDVKAVGGIGFPRWRDFYIRYLGYHTLYNATWSTSNNGIKTIDIVCVYIPAT
ncbi:hypothetical protein [Mycoplasma sp. B6400]|uniref:hypothetical protein n=1 Tax=Mycoplasma sp. B6400 TaxID=3401674 RepID=UPI003AAF02FD